jgi:very-short-patch-repair endonuclease
VSEAEGALRSERKTLERARDLRKRMTDAETILWARIRPRECPTFRFRRQHPVGPYIADFACPLSRLVIEVDGATHGSDEEIAYDQKRDAFMHAHGWTVIRITNDDIYRRQHDTVDTILQQTPPPSRRLHGGPPPP